MLSEENKAKSKVYVHCLGEILHFSQKDLDFRHIICSPINPSGLHDSVMIPFLFKQAYTTKPSWSPESNSKYIYMYQCFKAAKSCLSTFVNSPSGHQCCNFWLIPVSLILMLSNYFLSYLILFSLGLTILNSSYCFHVCRDTPGEN